MSDDADTQYEPGSFGHVDQGLDKLAVSLMKLGDQYDAVIAERDSLRKRVEELEAQISGLEQSGDKLHVRYGTLLTAARDYRAALDVMAERGNVHDSERLNAAEAKVDALLAESGK